MKDAGTQGTDVREISRAFLGVVILAAVATTLVLESTRVFLSFIMFNIEANSRYSVLISVAAAVPAIGLGGILFQSLLLVVYFFVSNVPLAIGLAYLALAACALRCGRPSYRASIPLRKLLAIPALLAILLATTTLWHVSTWSEPAFGPSLDSHHHRDDL